MWTCVLWKWIQNKIQAIGMRCTGRVKDVTVRDGIRYTKIREELETKPVLEYTEERCWAGRGHLRRMNENMSVKSVWRTKV